MGRKRRVAVKNQYPEYFKPGAEIASLIKKKKRRPPVCLVYLCPSVCLYVHPTYVPSSVCRNVCQFVYLSLSPRVCLSVCICMSVCI